MRVMMAMVLAAAGVAALGAQAQPKTMTAKEQANLKHVLSWWLECLEGRNLEATAKYQADGYIQHNINFHFQKNNASDPKGFFLVVYTLAAHRLGRKVF